MVQHHDSVPSLNCTAISIDSPHMHRDGANYLNLLFGWFLEIHTLNMTFPFDYNLLILLVDEEYMVCPTTFIVKISKIRGTSVY